jgi:hypothetical protein
MNINFIGVTDEVYEDFPAPYSSNTQVPSWYNEMPNYTNDKKTIGIDGVFLFEMQCLLVI